jgi:small subunit ribosomal protein S21
LLKVKVGKTEPIDSAMRRLSKNVQKAGLVAEIKRRMAFESRKARVKRRKASTIRRERKRAGLSV